jgi:hypothetical protein
VQQRTKEFPMIRNSTRYSLIASLLASAPWLCGADGSGCDKAHSPSSATDVGSLCVAEEGQHCGGNIAHPCSCGTGLFCTSGSSALPSGDAGGTCEKAASTAAGSGGGRASAGAGSSQGGQGADAGQPAPVDGGECVSKQGERCGGNTLHPCTCSPGLSCKSNLGGPAPGDVGGTCQLTADAADGGVCVSVEGGSCGGNIRNPCTCADGLTCTPDPNGPAPGDVGGTCKTTDKPVACKTAADCRLAADYCTGCECVALSLGQKIKPCSGPGVRCLVDPCGAKTAACENGSCVAH